MESDLIEEKIVHLIQENYYKLHKTVFQEIISKISTLDIKEKLFESLQKGFIGFQIEKHPCVLNFTPKQKQQIYELLQQKIDQCGLHNVALVSLFQEIVMIVVNLKYIHHKYPNILTRNYSEFHAHIQESEGFLIDKKVELHEKQIAEIFRQFKNVWGDNWADNSLAAIYSRNH